jgi:chromosomal replication initiator protein
LLGISVDLEFAKRELFATGSVARTETSIEDIQRAVCHHFKLKASDLTSKDRHKSIAFARHVAMYLCKTRLKCSLPELGRAFGGRDHTTVLAAVRKVDGLRATSSELRAHLDVLETRLGA